MNPFEAIGREDDPSDWRADLPPLPQSEADYGSNVVQLPLTKSDALVISQFPKIAPSAIPPRPWAYGHFLMFGVAGVIGAVDGGGKGTIATAMCLSFISGRPLLDEHVWRKGPVGIITYEDDEVEWHRRFSAACIHYGLPYEEVLAQVYFFHRKEGRVVFARAAGDRLVHPHSDDLISTIRELGIVFLLVDPFNHAHDLPDGNSNTLIAKVAGEVSRVARETMIAVLVLHHLRKGSTGAADDLMGATSLRATFRSCRILSRMDSEVAKNMNIPDPFRYSRIAGTKENYAPPPEKARWFKLVSVALGNPTDAYPEGDSVGVATTWRPRTLFQGMDADTLAAVFQVLRSKPHGFAKQSRAAPWAGIPLVDIGKRSEREASTIINSWLESGVMAKEEMVTPTRNKATVLVLDEAKASEILNDLNMEVQLDE